MNLRPQPAPTNVSAAWRDTVEDAGLALAEVALMWRSGRPRPGFQEAATWKPDTDIDAEVDDDPDFLSALRWANGGPVRGLKRVMIWVDRSPEGLDGLLRHELEHAIQLARHPDLDFLHGRALEEIARRGGTGTAYNAIPMEVDANRAAARYLRRRYGAERLRQLVDDGARDSACFRPTADPLSLETLRDRMLDFIGRAMREDDFVSLLESGPFDS